MASRRNLSILTKEFVLRCTVGQTKETAKIGGRLRLPDLLALSDFIWTTVADKIEIDFAKYTHSSIFDLTFLSHQIRHAQLKKMIKIEAINHEHMEWARGMNFFSVSGTDWASGVEVRTGDGTNFIPITIVECTPNGVALTLSEMNEQIDRQAAHLAGVLLHLGSGPAYDAIQYAFREVIRNIFEHSAAKLFLMSGQYYPKHRNVQIVISDNGQGIPNALRWNKNFARLNDRDALSLALMPGVSGNERAMTLERRDIWQNSGYGLYMMSRLARNRGMMTVISGGHAVHINNAEGEVKSKENFAVAKFAGTPIRLGIHITDDDLAARLQKWAEEGKAIARDIRGAKQISASAASLLLRRDFERSS